MTLRPYSATIQQNFRDVMSTPAAPEAFDDQTPLAPTVDVSLQKDTESILQVVGKQLISTSNSATNATVTLFTAGSNGARLHSGNLTAISGAGNGVCTLTANSLTVAVINAYNLSSQSNNFSLGNNFILVAAGTVVSITSPNVNITITAAVHYRQL